MSALPQEELAVRAGASLGLIQRMVELGIVAPREDGAFDDKDVLRVRLIRALEGSGISLEEIASGIEGGHISLRFAAFAMGDPIGVLGRTHREVADELGLPLELVGRIRAAIGDFEMLPDDPVREDDAEVFRIGAQALVLGLSEDSLVRTARVFSENLRRVVDFELELVRSDVEDPMLQAGLTEQEMLDRMALARGQLEPLSEQVLHLIHRRHQERAFFQDVIEHLEAALEKAGLAKRRQAGPPTMAFLALAGSTGLTEDQGDDDAPALLSGLVDVVQETARRHEGRPVRLLGDGVMLLFPQAPGAVLAALDLVEEIPRRGLPRSRVGMSSGPVVVRDGDYFGRTVNEAGRIADYARPGEVLVSEDVRRSAELDEVSYRPVGEVELKGITEPVSLHRALRAS